VPLVSCPAKEIGERYITTLKVVSQRANRHQPDDAADRSAVQCARRNKSQFDQHTTRVVDAQFIAPLAQCVPIDAKVSCSIR